MENLHKFQKAINPSISWWVEKPKYFDLKSKFEEICQKLHQHYDPYCMYFHKNFTCHYSKIRPYCSVIFYHHDNTFVMKNFDTHAKKNYGVKKLKLNITGNNGSFHLIIVYCCLSICQSVYLAFY